MATVVRGAKNTLLNMEKKQHFHRAMELNISIGSDAMRNLIKTYLTVKGVTLKEHLSEVLVKDALAKYRDLGGENYFVLESANPKTDDMDVSVLSVLILHTFPKQITTDVKRYVKGLRRNRNHLAHAVKAELDDETLFKDSSQMIIGIAQKIGQGNSFALELVKTVNELRRRELVNNCSNLERVKINNEMFLIKLVESDGKENVDEDESAMIKVGMTKWTRQLARGINVGLFITSLKDESVINDTVKRQIEEEYSYEEQIQALVLHMMNETRFNICKWCRCLRHMSPQLADLIENKNTDGKETDQYIEDYENDNITRVLKEKFIVEKDSSVPTDRVHVVVEQQLELPIDFTRIRRLVLEVFPEVRQSEDSSFAGLMLRSSTCDVTNTETDEEEGLCVSRMSCEQFAKYVADTLSKIKDTLYKPFHSAFTEHIISPKAFAEMTKDEMKEIFPPFLGNIKFGFGIQKELVLIQKQIKNDNQSLSADNLQMLRPFDKPVGKISYEKRYVRSQTGNILTPKQDFRWLSSGSSYTSVYVAKEVVKFVAACINGRRNGTLYFGIKPLPNGTGQIIGIPASRECTKHLNEEITHSIQLCFKDNATVAFRCVRPVQVVPVENDTVIIEVDVVPFSKHIDTTLLPIYYPPKGYQEQHCFIYDLKPDCDILPVPPRKMHELEEIYMKVFEERKRLEDETDHNEDNRVLLRKQLVNMLTGGNRYLTDAFVPVIVSGEITGCNREESIRNELDMERAFASCNLILDFDSSVELRNKFEGEQRLYTVKTADDFHVDSEFSHASPTWFYCNGNEELGEEQRQSEVMSMEDWLENRSDGVNRSLELMKNMIPKTRAKVIFLLYKSNANEQRPIYEIARTAFMSSFRNQCMVIAESEEMVKDLKSELIKAMGAKRIENFFFTGLNWADISQLMNSVSRMNPDVVCKLPHCDGHFVEMTKKEREEGKFIDIDILSGEECLNDEIKMSDQDRKLNRNEAQQRFYRGGPVSSWNFYYKSHVGKRDLFDRHKSDINDKFTGKGETLIEIHEIEHHPGAGGSTLGKHLLWHFSQFKHAPEKAYRCCAIRSNSVTEDTINQIARFRNFKEGDCPKPFIVLADNKSEDSIVLLKTKLHELAYKTGCPGKLFCLILIINRMPIMHEDTRGKPLLKHRLSTTEQNWFESKYKDMEKSDDIDVKSLIAFNFMRKSFDPSYMQKTVESVMQGVSKKEIKVLQCLALISSFESDHPVPENVFDQMMSEEIDIELLIGKPWGIAHTVPEFRQIAKFRNGTWNIRMSNAMDLLIAKKEDIDFYNTGVCLISQLLARTVLDYIKAHERLTTELIVISVLDLVETQIKESNPMSKRFVKIVCSLFKTRQLLESERGDIKEKFSDLVLDLEQPDENETDVQAQQRVLRAMGRCFDITEDAMVGQQLARFNIHIKEFEAAKIAIKRSLEKRPKSSYLFDTFGQIFKSKMEYLVDHALQNEGRINNKVATEIVNLAFNAIEKFKEGQDIAVSFEDDTNWGCFHTEVKTALFLLEKFEKFDCFTSRQELVSFLNEEQIQVNNSPFLELMGICSALENLRAGSEAQCHLETSLRCLEERNYQVKRELYTIHSENETLLLKLRERFERFYGSPDSTSKYQFTYGIGLKPLMVAKEKDAHLLVRRVEEARANLERSGPKQGDERDLLVYLGDKIISLSGQAVSKHTENCSITEYKRLLSYSNKLVSIQTTSPRSKRLYLETFLYHAMLHWPLQSRTQLELDVLTRPATYEQLIKQWEDSYNKNFFINNTEQHRKNRPKNYFALGKGTPGNDIVDLESIRKEWMNRQKKSTGRVRKPVFADNFWSESFVEERLERLEGTVDGSGHVVIHKAKYPLGTHTFKINTYYPCTGLSNRIVTFVLGFTWKGPTAFDVEEKSKTDARPKVEHDEGPSSLNSDDGNGHVQASVDSAAGLLPQAVADSSSTPVLEAEGEHNPEMRSDQVGTNDGRKPETGSVATQHVAKSRRRKKNQRKK